MSIRFCLLLVGGLLAVSSTAHADDLFVLTLPDSSIWSFSLPATPTQLPYSPSACPNSAEYDFCVDAVVTGNGTTSEEMVAFYTTLGYGGFTIGSGSTYLVNEIGTQLFTDGTFNLGTYALTDVGNDAFLPSQLTITSTPEPSTLALLGTGLLGVVGAASRRLT